MDSGIPLLILFAIIIIVLLDSLLCVYSFLSRYWYNKGTK